MDVLTRPEPVPEAPRPPRKARWIASAVAVTVIVTAAIAGVVRGPAVLDPDTPEATVQSYLQAVFDGDLGAAHDLLAEDAAERCTIGDFRQAWVPGSLTATLDEVRTHDGGEVDVRVHLRSNDTSGPFGVDGGYTAIETFTLIDEDGTWHLTGEPWPVFACGGPS